MKEYFKEMIIMFMIYADVAMGIVKTVKYIKLVIDVKRFIEIKA